MGDDTGELPLDAIRNAHRAEEVAEERKDRSIGGRVFLVVAAIITLLAVLYAPSKEIAGIVMLAVAALLALFCGVFLWRATARLNAEDARIAAGGVPEVHDAGPAFLPESSPWPFGIALGATLILNGLIIGTWFVVPGVMLLVVSLGGFARQSRHRFNR